MAHPEESHRRGQSSVATRTAKTAVARSGDVRPGWLVVRGVFVPGNRGERLWPRDIIARSSNVAWILEVYCEDATNLVC